MAYYTKITDRMDIHIEEGRGTILIKQKWRYFWLNYMNTSRWTYDEKQKFHNSIDKNSIMNAGMELRGRHLDYLIKELNTMISNSAFSIY